MHYCQPLSTVAHRCLWGDQNAQGRKPLARLFTCCHGLQHRQRVERCQWAQLLMRWTPASICILHPGTPCGTIEDAIWKESESLEWPHLGKHGQISYLTERNASVLRIPSSVGQWKESGFLMPQYLKLPHAPTQIYSDQTWLTQRDPHGHCVDLSARCLRLSQQLQGASPSTVASLAGWTETWLRVLRQPTIVVGCRGECGSQRARPMISNCTLAMQATPSKLRLMAHWPPHKELPTVLKPCRNQQASPIPTSPATVGKCWAKDLMSELKPRRFDLIWCQDQRMIKIGISKSPQIWVCWPGGSLGPANRLRKL